MVNVIMELIDRFIEFILKRLPDKATDNEKHRYVMRMMVISFSVLFWGLIAITIANVDLKRDNYALSKSVSKVNTLLDVNSPDNPLNSLLLLNNESLVKLHKVNRENDRLIQENMRLAVMSNQLRGYLKQCTLLGGGEFSKQSENEVPNTPVNDKFAPPFNGIKEDETVIEDSRNSAALKED